MRVRGERHSSVGSTTPQSRRLARDALVGHRLLAGFGLDDDIRSRIDKAFVTIRPPHVIRRLAVVATHLENLRVPRRLANTVPRNFQMITWFGMHPFTSRLFWAWPINTPESLGFVGHKVPCDSGPASRRHPTSRAGEPQRRSGRPVASRGDFRPWYRLQLIDRSWPGRTAVSEGAHRTVFASDLKAPAPRRPTFLCDL